MKGLAGAKPFFFGAREHGLGRGLARRLTHDWAGRAARDAERVQAAPLQTGCGHSSSTVERRLWPQVLSRRSAPQMTASYSWPASQPTPRAWRRPNGRCHGRRTGTTDSSRSFAWTGLATGLKLLRSIAL